MDRIELIKSSEYWTTKFQLDLYNCAMQFMAENNMNRTQLAKYLGVSKGYISQLLNGDYDHKLSKLVELALAFGFVPDISFVKTEEYLRSETKVSLPNKWIKCEYTPSYKIEKNSIPLKTSLVSLNNNNVA